MNDMVFFFILVGKVPFKSDYDLNILVGNSSWSLSTYKHVLKLRYKFIQVYTCVHTIPIT